MLIEILPRIWIADKMHSRSKIENVVLIDENLKSVYDTYNFIERQHKYAKYIEKMIKFLYYYTVIKMNSVMLVDSNIHSRHDAYVLLIAYMSYYGKIRWQEGYHKIKHKTIPFQLSSFSLGVFNLLQENVNG